MDKKHVPDINRLSPNSHVNISIGQIFNCKNTGDYSIVSSIIDEISNNDTRLFINKMVNIVDYDLCVHILNNTNNTIFINKFKIDIVNHWLSLYMDNQTSLEIKNNFESFLLLLNNEEIITILSNANMEQLMIIINTLEYKFHSIKNYYVPNDLDKIKYVHHNYNYDDDAIKTYIFYNILQKNYVNYEIIDWLIQEFPFISNKTEEIIRELYNSNYTVQNIKIIYKFIHYLLKKIDLNASRIYELFKNIIFDGNCILYTYISIKYFAHLDKLELFDAICINTDPNKNILDTVLHIAFVQLNVSNYNIDNLFIKLCKYNFVNIVKWLTDIFPYNFNIVIENNKIISYNINDSNLQMVVDEFFISKNIKLQSHTNNNNHECCVCYEKKSNMLELNCHNTHIVCDTCIKTWTNTSNNCPLCRSNIFFTQCIMHIYL